MAKDENPKKKNLKQPKMTGNAYTSLKQTTDKLDTMPILLPHSLTQNKKVRNAPQRGAATERTKPVAPSAAPDAAMTNTIAMNC